MRRFLNGLACALAAASFFSAPAVVSAQPSGRLTVALPAEPATLDPHKGNTRYNYLFNSNMFEGLVMRNDKAELVPGLAESYTVSPDGLTYTFTLRRGVRFHDGTPMTAEDVSPGRSTR